MPSVGREKHVPKNGVCLTGEQNRCKQPKSLGDAMDNVPEP